MSVFLFVPAGSSSGGTTQVVSYDSFVEVSSIGGNETEDTAAFNAAIATGKNLLIPPSTSGQPYILNGVTSPAGLTWLFQGGVVEVAGAVTIHGSVDGPRELLFEVPAAADAASSLLKIRSNLGRVAGTTYDAADISEISPEQKFLCPEWFTTPARPTTTVTIDGSDYTFDEFGHRVNLCFQVGGGRTVVELGSRLMWIDTTISMDDAKWGSHLVIRGQGFHTSHFYMSGTPSAFCGIDASLADEGRLYSFKINEQTGSKQGMCIALGGTSLVVGDVWVGNAKYGFYQNKGTGTKCVGLWAENCDYNRYIHSGDDQSATISGAPTASSGINRIHEVSCTYFSASITNLYIRRLTNRVKNLQFKAMDLSQTGGGTGPNVHVFTNSSAGLNSVSIDGEIVGSGTYGLEVNKADVKFTGAIIDPGNDIAVHAIGDGVAADGECRVELDAMIGDSVSSQTITRFTTTGNAVINDRYPDRVLR